MAVSNLFLKRRTITMGILDESLEFVSLLKGECPVSSIRMQHNRDRIPAATLTTVLTSFTVTMLKPAEKIYIFQNRGMISMPYTFYDWIYKIAIKTFVGA